MANGVVDFDYAVWSIRYPTLALTVAEPQAQEYWNMAGLFLVNDSTSKVTDDAPGGKRDLLLGMITAHIASLELAGASGSGLVGPIASATEGSVSISTHNLNMPWSAAWWYSTPYGRLFWQATINYRRGYYINVPWTPALTYPNYFRRQY